VGALLDTHTLYWFVTESVQLDPSALVAISDARAAGQLYVSPMTAWELSVAAQKRPGPGRPNLGDLASRQWFSEAIAIAGAKVTPIRQLIALEAAEVATIYGRKDPGDCFLIATARVKLIPIVTRDSAMRDLARDRPDYLTVIAC
jgi:PIN domain nuclease of toxin-antitoxin system